MDCVCKQCKRIRPLQEHHPFFCSPTCKRIYEHEKGINVLTERKCLMCGKDLTFERGNKLYCSSRCRANHFYQTKLKYKK